MDRVPNRAPETIVSAAWLLGTVRYLPSLHPCRHPLRSAVPFPTQDPLTLFTAVKNCGAETLRGTRGSSHALLCDSCTASVNTHIPLPFFYKFKRTDSTTLDERVPANFVATRVRKGARRDYLAIPQSTLLLTTATTARPLRPVEKCNQQISMKLSAASQGHNMLRHAGGFSRLWRGCMENSRIDKLC